jgi:type I restriction enzyme M protein
MRGAGLFAYLRGLQGANGGDRRDVIATVFRGTVNRMINGYLLRDVINKVNSIHFTSSEEIHTLGHLYESMLKEMRDAAGDSGEFYTPRAVVRFMVEVIDPRLGETVLDPACGTGGFLVEAYQHLEKQCRTVQDRLVLQTASLFGGEAKSLPYLLAQMNLLLHGLESPRIDSGNSLRFPLKEIGDKDRVDIILTNPPFGGEEERGIRGNFPEDKQTSETALLFLQLIMRKLKRPPKPGRAGIVVPNGTLFGDGVCARIKEELLKEFNLHTIVRLPNGVFAPYTSIPTNLLFFDRSGPTKEVWYYEQPLPEGLYSKDGATRGRPCFVDSDREFSIFVSVALIKPLCEQLDGRYLCHLLNSTWIRDHMVDKSRGDMIPHIVLGEIRQFPVPVLLLSEQHRIVAYLNDLQTKVDALKRMQAETAAELDALLPSVLDKAFKGEL